MSNPPQTLADRWPPLAAPAPPRSLPTPLTALLGADRQAAGCPNLWCFLLGRRSGIALGTRTPNTTRGLIRPTRPRSDPATSPTPCPNSPTAPTPHIQLVGGRLTRERPTSSPSAEAGSSPAPPVAVGSGPSAMTSGRSGGAEAARFLRGICSHLRAVQRAARQRRAAGLGREGGGARRSQRQP